MARGALGIELYEPLDLGPLRVQHLAASLPGLSFPLDLSGGVKVFRHRRGELEAIELGVDFEELAVWASHRLRETGSLSRVSLRPLAGGAGIGVGLLGSAQAVGFDLLWAPIDDEARFVVARARGVGLAGAALGYALRALDSVLGRVLTRSGRLVSFPRAGLSVARAVMPAVGARAPSAGHGRFGTLEVDQGVAKVVLDSTFAPPALAPDAARALELAELVAEADDALAAGRIDDARKLYMAALEQAPRHPEIVGLVAELDSAVGGRAEAALGLLVESVQARSAGTVGAELLARVGDFEGARDAIADAASAEEFGPLAALMWRRLAELETDGRARLDAHDEAVARAPALAEVRWARFDARLGRGDIDGALADAEHLEAAATGSLERHEVCRRAGERLLGDGYVQDAGKMFERALRYLPDDPKATAGVARSLLEMGKPDRAVALLERAVALGEKKSSREGRALLELGRVLAEHLRDLPQAIARVRQIPPSDPLAIEARALEGRWRAALGDIAGASLAYGRLRELVEAAPSPEAKPTAQWLAEAGKFERETLDDPIAAERHLATAIRLVPQDRRIGAAYRDVAAVVAARSRRGRPTADRPNPETERPRSTSSPPPDPRDSMLAVELEAKVRANPDDVHAVTELAEVFERIGRDRELFALLAARLDESDGEFRAELVSRARATLQRLIEAATADENLEEAAAFHKAIEDLAD